MYTDHRYDTGLGPGIATGSPEFDTRRHVKLRSDCFYTERPEWKAIITGLLTECAPQSKSWLRKNPSFSDLANYHSTLASKVEGVRTRVKFSQIEHLFVQYCFISETSIIQRYH